MKRTAGFSAAVDQRLILSLYFSDSGVTTTTEAGKLPFNSSAILAVTIGILNFVVTKVKDIELNNEANQN